MDKLLCPLKFITMNGWLKNNDTGDVTMLNQDRCHCEKEKCAWWTIRNIAGDKIDYQEKGCALQILAGRENFK